MTNNNFFSKRLSSVMCVISTMTRFSLASLICLCMLTLGVGNAWGDTYSLVVSKAALEDGAEYILLVNNRSTAYNGSISSGHLQTGATWSSSSTTAGSAVTLSSGSAYKIQLVKISGDTYKIKDVSNNKFIRASAAKSGSFYLNASDNYGWTFTGTSSLNAQYQETSKKAYLRSYSNNTFRSYANTSTGQTFYLAKVISGTNHTLSSAVSPVGGGTVALSATSVAEGSTATATATPATHYVFDHWSISGTGSTLSSTTTNPTTVTMGTANTTVTATFVAAPKASITLSEAGATTTDASTYYVGDSYTLPSSTGASCGSKVLVGWSTVEVAETNTKPTSNFYEKGASVTLAATQTFYAVFATASGGGGSPTAYTAGDEGTYVLAIYVSDTWYALPATPTVSSGKISGKEITVSNTGGVDYVTSANASGYEWTIADATNGQTISDGSKYIYHSNGGVSGTNLTYGTGTTYTWTIASEANGLTFKGTNGSTVNSRGLLASGTTFGGYSLSNEDASGYYRIHVLPIGGGTTYSAYSTTCCTALGTINGSISLSNAGNNVTASGWTATTGGNETGYLVKLYNSDKSSVITSANTGSKATKTHTFSNPEAGTYWVSVTPTYSGAGDYCSEGTETFSATSITVTGNVTITFKKNGGSGTDDQTQSVPYNTSTALKTLAQVGYTAPSCKEFYGWADSQAKADAGTRDYTDGQSVTLTTGKTLYAVWKTITYTVTKGTCTTGTFNLSPASSIDCDGTITVTGTPDASHKGDPIVSISPADAGTVSGTSITNVSKNITVNVEFAAKEVYTVTYNNGAGTGVGSTNTAGSFDLPSATPPITCDAEGWTFAGWTTESVSETTTTPDPLYAAGSSYTPTSNITLYAVYQRTEGVGSTSYVLTAANAVTAGTYVIGITGLSGYYIATGLTGSSSVDMAVNTTSDVTLTNNAFTTLPANGMELTFSGNNTDGFTISNSGGDKLSYSSYENRRLSFDATGKTWKVIEDNSKLVLQSHNSDGYYTISQNGTNSIRGYASDTKYNTLYLFKKTGGSTTTYNSNPKCCTQPKTPLTITADQIELVKSGVVTLTATGGNGTDITWTTTGGVLSNQSNTGATLTISDVDATQNITVTATQAENNNDDEVVYCAQEASIDITVKAQWTITFQTNDNGVKNSNSILVTDGESYTMPDISDEYVCNSGSSFAGWVDNKDDTEVDATPNSTQTATADQTWYAAWSSSSNTKSVDIYQLVTNVTNLAAGDEVWITNTTPTVAMGVQNDNNRGQVTVTKHPTESDKIYSTGSPATLTIGKDGTYYTFYDGTGYTTGYLYAASLSKNYLRLQATNNANGKWSITIEDGKATITAQGTNTHNKLKYNSSSSIFSCYESGQGDVRIYKNVGTAEIEVSGASITTNNTSCHRGAVIFAENGKWITSSKGQKVRIAINVTARGFESDATLSATSANEHFSVVSITNTTITKNSAFETQMMIEYQPAEANTNENAEITLVAKKGEEVVATRTIDVNGRSLPDEFVIVAQYNDKWLAVPANMQSGADQYNGIEVTPNNELTQIPAAPSTTIYSLRGVADNRYEAAGTCVRLVGNGNKCLWGNAASTNTTIQNWTTLGATNGSNYEWLLTTSDGEQYTIANPEHPDYDEGRILSNSGSKYGLYKGTTKFYILPVGCSSLPGNIQVTARRVDATFSWETNASTVTIDLYTNEGMTEGHKTASVTDVPYLFSSLAENTQYWYKLTPDADDDCAVTGTFKTTGPVIDVVEWGENSATIYVDKDEAVDPRIIIAGEVEHGQGGIVATDIFFSKYFEAEGTAKLLAIYNGTANAISLADITILQRTSDKNTPLSLASYGKTAGWIQPGEEIVLFNRDSRDAVMECAENNETYDSWINVENNNLSFSGKGTIRLFRGNTCIDIIGAMNAGDNAANMNDKKRDPMEGAASPSFGDDKGFVTSFGDNYKTPAEETDYELSTNRCLLIRRAFVTSGDSALLNNFGDFKTLGTYTGVDSKTHKGEWSGLQIPTAGLDETDYIHTCAGFEDAGSFDYNKYYKEFSTISDDKYLSDFTRADDGTYTLLIEYMRQYACMNLKFQLTAHDDPTDVLTEQLVQVPIVVKDERNSNDTLFNNIIKQDVEPHAPMVTESINRCKTCNVVVLGTGTLTKVADGSTNDVAEIRDVKVYPGGKLIIPEGTHYVVNSLALRRQEDVVAAAKINSGLADDPDDKMDKGIYIRESNGVYLDVRIDPSKWHYFTLPYDCRVGDVRFADGTPAKVNTDYLISWYDGAYRAEHKTGGWTDITSDDYVLKAGLGYIVALPGSGLIKRELRFPMANNVIAEELGDKTVGGLYAYGGDKTDEELRPNHKGWNMIGNPYLYDYTTDIVTDPLAVGELEHDPSGSSWNGKWVRTGSARYIVAPIDDNGWKGYEQTTISNLRPFMSYFIQVGTKTDGTENPETERSITFDKDQKPASIIRRAQAEDAEPMYPVWYGLELLAPNGEKDNTTLLISNEFTDDYDMMDDLIKMRGSYYNYYQNPVLASRNNSGEMAFNALPDSSAAVIGVPLNYYAYQAGTYTFATDSRYDLEEVKSAMLFDATTQQYYDLLTENHSFSLAKGDNNARFKLYVRVERKKPQITTDVDNLLVDGQLSLIALDKTLVLSGLTDAADIYVYDATGKLIRSDLSASGGGIWRTNVPAQGVYFVRVNSTTSQQTLRTVVK